MSTSGTTPGERFMASAGGCVVAEVITLPVDVAKVRLQTQVKLAGGALKYRNTLHAIGTVARKEGARALWKGLNPALLRQVSYTGLTLVMYKPIRDIISGEGESISFVQRILASGTSGGLAIMVTNPTDVIKTRMQTQTVGTPRMAPIVRDILAKEGVGGLFRGLAPNVARSVVGMACEVGCYDQFKSMIVDHGILPDGTLSHFAASSAAGMVSAVFSTPVDVVKTRLMNQAGSGGMEEAGRMKRYTGVFDCFLTIPKEEGFVAFYKGFVPLCVRKISWSVTFFLAYEKALLAISGKYSD
jgi:hypothetical protein